MPNTTENKWILVTDRLPKKNTLVLVYHSFGIGIFRYDGNGRFCELIFGAWYQNYTVTHWMPLPEPPKGE